MFQLRSFVHQRLYAAAEEILGEVEKTIRLALYEAQRPRPDPDIHRPKPGCVLQIPEPPLVHSDAPEKEMLQTPAPPSTREEPHLSKAEAPGPSETTEESRYIQIDVRIKEEQEDHGHESQTAEVIYPLTDIVKGEQDQPENEESDEMLLIYSDGCEAESRSNGSDEDWMRNRDAQRAKRQKLCGNSSSESQRDYHVCPACGKGFQYIRPFVKHIKKHKNSEAIKELLKNVQSLNNKAFVCDCCGKRFTTAGGRKVHSKIHAGIKDFKCQVCGVTFVQKGNLISHLRTHSGERPFQCDLCGKAFSQKQNLTSHRRRHASRDEAAMDQMGDNITAFH